jgi:hypothetical protein
MVEMANQEALEITAPRAEAVQVQLALMAPLQLAGMAVMALLLP